MDVKGLTVVTEYLNRHVLSRTVALGVIFGSGSSLDSVSLVVADGLGLQVFNILDVHVDEAAELTLVGIPIVLRGISAGAAPKSPRKCHKTIVHH